MDELQASVRAVLVTEKFGMEFGRFRESYYTLTDEQLPVGFRSLDELASKMPKVVRVSFDPRRNARVLQLVPCAEVEHIDRLVKGQKYTKPKPIRVKPAAPVRRYGQQSYPATPARSMFAPRLLGRTAPNQQTQSNHHGGWSNGGGGGYGGGRPAQSHAPPPKQYGWGQSNGVQDNGQQHNANNNSPYNWSQANASKSASHNGSQPTGSQPNWSQPAKPPTNGSFSSSNNCTQPGRPPAGQSQNCAGNSTLPKPAPPAPQQNGQSQTPFTVAPALPMQNGPLEKPELASDSIPSEPAAGRLSSQTSQPTKESPANAAPQPANSTMPASPVATTGAPPTPPATPPTPLATPTTQPMAKPEPQRNSPKHEPVQAPVSLPPVETHHSFNPYMSWNQSAIQQTTFNASTVYKSPKQQPLVSAAPSGLDNGFKTNRSPPQPRQTNTAPSSRRGKEPKDDEGYRMRLLELVTEKRLPLPVYQTSSTITRNKAVIYLSKVTLEDESWHSYPAKFYSPDDAEDEAARKAYMSLRGRADRKVGGSLDQSLTEEKRRLVDRIVEILKAQPITSLFSTAIPDLFLAKFAQPVPENWLAVIEEFPRDLQVERLFATRITVGIPTAEALKKLEQNDDARNAGKLSSPDSPGSIASSGSQDGDSGRSSADEVVTGLDRVHLEQQYGYHTGEAQLLPPSLLLPATRFWNVLLLQASLGHEVIMRLVDTSDEYSDFIDRLSAFYPARDGFQVNEVVVGRIYAAVFQDSTMRVQALRQDGILVHCMFVDEGGFEPLPRSILREIPNEMLQLPFQAFSVQLANVDARQTDTRLAPLLQKRIDEAPSGLVLVAEPINRSHPVQVRLLDTSTEQDIDVNEQLLQELDRLDRRILQLQRQPLHPELLHPSQQPTCPEQPETQSPPSSTGAVQSEITSPIAPDAEHLAQPRQTPTAPDMLLHSPEQLSGAQCVPSARLPEVQPRPKCDADFFHATVRLAASPQNFVVHELPAAGQPADCAYARLCEDMQELYGGEEPIELHPSLILPRTPVAGRDADGRWKRARVQAILSPAPEMSVLVQLVDEGGPRVMDLQRLQPLYSQFAQLPAQAIRAALHDVRPKDADWDPISVYKFGQLVQDRQFRCVVHDVMHVDGEPVLQLALFRKDDGTSISDQLVTLGLARKLA